MGQSVHYLSTNLQFFSFIIQIFKQNRAKKFQFDHKFNSFIISSPQKCPISTNHPNTQHLIPNTQYLSNINRYAEINVKDIESEVCARSETAAHFFTIDCLLLIFKLKAEHSEGDIERHGIHNKHRQTR